jgi:hypothetical protein
VHPHACFLDSIYAPPKTHINLHHFATQKPAKKATESFYAGLHSKRGHDILSPGDKQEGTQMNTTHTDEINRRVKALDRALRSDSTQDLLSWPETMAVTVMFSGLGAWLVSLMMAG